MLMKLTVGSHETSLPVLISFYRIVTMFLYDVIQIIGDIFLIPPVTFYFLITILRLSGLEVANELESIILLS
jgi:hypothetical protein